MKVKKSNENKFKINTQTIRNTKLNKHKFKRNQSSNKIKINTKAKQSQNKIKKY